MYFLRFAQLALLPLLLGAIPAIMLVRHYIRRRTTYLHPLGSTLGKKGLARRHPRDTILSLSRFASLILLAFMVAKPQLVDQRTRIQVEGIDIMLVLDASGSMQLNDYAGDQRTRFDVAKQEAIRFIEKREHDALGLVLFGNGAVSRAPLTPDKRILHELVQEATLGEVVPPDGTKLFTGIASAVNRLKGAKARSKVMILLTDGEPTDGDIDGSIALELAKQFGIKIYTVGIGNEEDGYIVDPFYGIVPKPKVNAPLLQKIAQETGGSFFMAHNAQDMRRVYDTIDRLEKTEKEVPLFSKYYDIFEPGAAATLCLLAGELILSALVWFGL